MAFTYAGTYDSDREKVRTNINDTVENAGPLPADANFSDALLAGIITAEGNWQRATAGCFEMLASAWNRYPSYSTDGLKLDRSDIADGFEKIAKKWRADFGYGERSYSPAMVAGQINIDGYSDDIANNAVTGNGDEYGGSFEYIVPGLIWTICYSTGVTNTGKMLDLTNNIHSDYAMRHGMGFISHRVPILTEQPGYWDMIPALLFLIRKPDTDYVFWLDADTLIVDDVDMRTALNGHSVGMTRHPGPPAHYNCGVLFLRANKYVAMWLERVQALAPGIYPWYQQDIMNEYIDMLEMHGLLTTLGHEWNSTAILGHPEQCHIRAWHGGGDLDKRMKLMRERIARL